MLKKIQNINLKEKDESRTAYKKWNSRKTKLVIILLLFAILVITYGYHGRDHKGHVYFLDVGQGDSILIVKEDVHVLIDGGGDRFMDDDFNKGKQVVLPFLLEMGMDELDCVFITHNHYDHIKGVLEIIGVVDIKQIILPKPYEPYISSYESKIKKEGITETVIAKSTIGENNYYDQFLLKSGDNELLNELVSKAAMENIPISFMEYGDYLDFNEFNMYCLYPKAGMEHEENENNNSLVLLMDMNGFRAVFTGDVEEEGEEWMVSNINWLPKVHMLKVPHHGSNSSSGDEFIKMINPEHAVTQVGYNSFGHPSDIIALRYYNNKIPMYTTQKYGMIEVVIDQQGYDINSYKGDLKDESIAGTAKE